MSLNIPLVALLLFAVHARADLACEAILNSEQTAALTEAARDDYAVEVLAREIDGRHHVVVLLGEVHTKTIHSAMIGRRVLNTFRTLAIEARRPKSTLAGYLRHRLARRQRPPQFWRERVRARATPNGRTEGSTTFEAHRRAWRYMYSRAIATADLTSVREQLTRVESSDEVDLVNVDGLSIWSMAEARALLRERLYGEPAGVPVEPPAVVFDLELGHRPGLLEELADVPIIENHGLVHTLPVFALGVVAIDAGQLLPWTIVPLASWVAGWAAYAEAGRHFSAGLEVMQERWYRLTFPLHGGMMHGRDDHMVERLIDISELATPVIAVVGRAHVPGLRRRLQAAGYRSPQ